MPGERHVNERPARRGQLHARGQPALDHRQVAGGQVPVQAGYVTAHFDAGGHRHRRRVDPRPGHEHHPQAGDLLFGQRERRGDPAQQRRPHSGTARGHQADPLAWPVAELGAQRLPVTRRGEPGDVPGEGVALQRPLARGRQSRPERHVGDVAGTADEDRAVPQPRVAAAALDPLRVPVRGEGGFRRPALGQRQEANEVGEPRVRRPLELGVVEKEVVDVPALVDDPQVVRLVGDQVVEDHEVRRHDLIHPADGLEHVQVVLARF